MYLLQVYIFFLINRSGEKGKTGIKTKAKNR